jgi:Amino acid transporters
VLVFLAVVNSTIANANACATVSTRTAFALARIKVFPRLFAHVHPRHRSPVAGVAAQCGVAVAAVLGLGLYYDPVTAFLLLATVIVTVVIGVYIVVNLACAGYFLRRRRELLKPVRHLLFLCWASSPSCPRC